MKAANQSAAKAAKRQSAAGPVRHSGLTSEIRNPKSTASGADYFKSPAPPRLIHLTADIVPAGDGTYRLVPRKPRVDVEEISTARAAQILGLGITATKALRDSDIGQRTLRWRFTTENCKVLKWELPSVLAYKEATRQIGK